MARRAPDLTFQTFGRLWALSPADKNKDGKMQWLCLCQCGNKSIVIAGDLKSDKAQSCGCSQKQAAKIVCAAKRTHGHASADEPSPTYVCWCSMKKRCNNPHNQFYAYYGGRGIKVCDRWNNFENFLADMGKKPKGLTLDRIDNEGNYEPANCRWATRKEQIANRRITKAVQLR